MKITQLPSSSNFASGDVLAIEISGKTYKLTGATLAAALESIGDYVTTDDMASTSADGLMSASDKRKLNGIAAGAQVNTITGVKGGAESSYRTGQVSLSATNVGAVPYTQLSGTDLDTVITPGLYYLTGASCTTSGETGLTMHLIVVANSSNDRVLQIRVGISGASMMYRVLYNGWSAWKTLALA